MSRVFRARLRGSLLGLGTVTGLTRRGWFIPYRFASSLPPGAGRTSYPALEAIFESRVEVFEKFASRMAYHLPGLLDAARGAPPAPRLDQDWVSAV